HSLLGTIFSNASYREVIFSKLSSYKTKQQNRGKQRRCNPPTRADRPMDCSHSRYTSPASSLDRARPRGRRCPLCSKDSLRALKALCTILNQPLEQKEFRQTRHAREKRAMGTRADQRRSSIRSSSPED